MTDRILWLLVGGPVRSVVCGLLIGVPIGWWADWWGVAALVIACAVATVWVSRLPWRWRPW